MTIHTGQRVFGWLVFVAVLVYFTINIPRIKIILAVQPINPHNIPMSIIIPILHRGKAVASDQRWNQWQQVLEPNSN